jgi:hypothetical protein
MKKGGSYPLRFFDPSAPYFAGNEGYDVLGVSENQVRPAIGGRQRRTRRSKRTKGFTSKRTKGGFIPSIMEPFVALCSKYVAPVAFLSAYKLMNSKKRSAKK